MNMCSTAQPTGGAGGPPAAVPDQPGEADLRVPVLPPPRCCVRSAPDATIMLRAGRQLPRFIDEVRWEMHAAAGVPACLSNF